MTTDQSIRDEETPLLYAERAREQVHQTPFPWFQFSILFALQTATHIPFYVTRPFIPDLIRSIGIAEGEKDVGLYVGLLISTIAASETATTFHLSQLSDHIGRKIVFLACTIGLSVFISGFGLSITFGGLIFCQALMGAFRGTHGVTRSMLARMTDSTDTVRAIAYYETSVYVAGTIGSRIGGSLSRPVDQFPQLFGSSKFLKEYPYFLPCAICSILLLTGWLVGTIFLKEMVREPLSLFSSLFKKKTQKDKCVMGEGVESTGSPLSLRIIFVPGIIVAAINLSSICLLQTFYSETEVLYLSTSIRDGGLGLSPQAIGILSSISSTVTGISQLFIFPRVHDKWGSRYTYVLGLFASVPLFVLWPLMNWIARKNGYNGLVWFALATQMCCSVLNQFGWLAISVFITQAYGSRAAALGFCEMVAGVLVMMAPAISNSLFSWSINKGYLGGYMVYFVFVCTAVMALCASSLLPRCDTKPGGIRSIE
ncbi:member of major facilitator superfamily multidrug-resistance, DHA1 sub-family [Amanita rubescens]|nr:member of major facilitator superfamily multidrug-resistance, DHA1 sub-family [Amanita rubescens]